jgi:hypothetical protein
MYIFKQKIWAMGLCAFLSSCTTQLKYHMSNHKFLTPETKGEFLKGDISLSYQQTQKVVVAEAFDYVIFNLPATMSTSPSIDRSFSIDIPINLGLFKRLDIFNQDSTFGLKYQFWGKPENDLTEEYKAALALSSGYDHQNNASQTYASSNSTRVYNTDMKVTSYEASFLLGYRFSEAKLAYLNIFRDTYNYKGALTSNQFAAINVSGKSYNQGAILGLNLTEKNTKHPCSVKIEVGVVDAKLDNRNSSTVSTFGTDIGWSW